MVRCRENGTEFGSCAKSGKVIRRGLRPLILGASDSDVTSRMNGVMHRIKLHDLVSKRGERRAATGLQTTGGRKELQGFDLNVNARLRNVLFCPVKITASQNLVAITGFDPQHDVRWPKAATHCKLRGGWLFFDLAGERSELIETNTLVLNKGQATTNAVLQAGSSSNNFAAKLFVLRLEFMQEINGLQYKQFPATFNSCNILEVFAV